MSEILKFPASENLKPFPEGIDAVLRSFGVPKPVREGIVAWARQADSEYRIPDMNLTITWPEGITDEQVDFITNEIRRNCTSYLKAASEIKYNYLMEQVKKQLTEFMNTP